MDKYGDAGAVRYGIEGAFNVALGKINVNRPNFQEYIRSFLKVTEYTPICIIRVWLQPVPH